MKFLRPHKLGKNSEHTKRLNRETVIGLLRQHGQLSRANLTRETELTTQSMSNIIAALEQSGLIQAFKKVYGGKGQPPTPYAIRPKAGYGIGIHLEQGQISGALVDFGFEVAGALEQRHDCTQPQDILGEVEAMVARLIATTGVSRDSLWGIGLASPRLVDEGINNMDLVEKSHWVDLGRFGLDDKLSKATRLPVFVENDANAGALGELTFGAGRELDHFCYLHIARGLGCGVVADNRIFRGAWGNAGEIGRFFIPQSKGVSYLESVLSVDGLVTFADAKFANGQILAGLAPDELPSFLLEHAVAVDAWVADAGELLRWLISILENTFDPQSILIGGHLPESLLQRLLDTASPLYFTISDRPHETVPRIQLSSLRGKAVALGAAAIPLFATIDADPAAHWRFRGQIKDVYQS